MVKLDRIYTRGGDGGETSLGGGGRVAKNDLRVQAYGTADEANAVIGDVRSFYGELVEQGLYPVDLKQISPMTSGTRN